MLVKDGIYFVEVENEKKSKSTEYYMKVYGRIKQKLSHASSFKKSCKIKRRIFSRGCHK